MCLSHSMAWPSSPHPLFWGHVAPATLTSCRPPTHQTHSCIMALSAAVPLAQNALPSYISMANSLTYLKSLLRCHVFNEIYSDHPTENCNSPLQLPTPLTLFSSYPFPQPGYFPTYYILYLLLVSFTVCLLTWERQPQEGRGPCFVHWYVVGT